MEQAVLSTTVSKPKITRRRQSRALSNRQRNVLILIAQGRTAEEIGHELNLGLKTINTHRSRGMKKMGLHNAAQVTTWAIRSGLLGDMKGSDDQAQTVNCLTLRENEVLALIARGNNGRKIAEILNIRMKTVETYRWRIIEKTDIHRQADMTRYAVRMGLIEA